MGCYPLRPSELRTRIPKYAAYKPNTVTSTPAITCDHTMPADGPPPNSHGEMMSHAPRTGSVQVSPWIRSGAEPKRIARTATVIPTISALTVCRTSPWNPTNHGENAA